MLTNQNEHHYHNTSILVNRFLRITKIWMILLSTLVRFDVIVIYMDINENIFIVNLVPPYIITNNNNTVIRKYYA